MTPKIHKRYIFPVCLLATLLFSGCRKTTDTVTTSQSDAGTINIIGSDELIVNNEVEQAVDEAVEALSISTTTAHRAENLLQTLVPGANIDTSQIDSGIVTVYYYGADRDTTKKRGGSVQIKLPMSGGKPVSWKTAGVTAVITITSFEIWYLKTNTSVWIQGSLTLTNVNGKLQKNLVPGDSVVEKLKGKIVYSDNDNNVVIQTWTWNLQSMRIVGMAANNDITVTIRADTAVGGYSNVVTWGQTRIYPTFYTSLNSPLFRDITGSNFYNPLSGSKLINGIPEPVTLTLGVDANGNPVLSGNPYGCKMNWTHNGSPQTLIDAYY